MVISSQCQPAIVYSVARVDELIALVQLDAGQAGVCARTVKPRWWWEKSR